MDDNEEKSVLAGDHELVFGFAALTTLSLLQGQTNARTLGWRESRT